MWMLSAGSMGTYHGTRSGASRSRLTDALRAAGIGRDRLYALVPHARAPRRDEVRVVGVEYFRGATFGSAKLLLCDQADQTQCRAQQSTRSAAMPRTDMF